MLSFAIRRSIISSHTKYNGSLSVNWRHQITNVPVRWIRNIGDCYRTLGIAENASSTDIRKAYIGLSKKYHPDKNNGKMGDKFKQIQDAYNQLQDMNSKTPQSDYNSSHNKNNKNNNKNNNTSHNTGSSKYYSYNYYPPNSSNSNRFGFINKYKLKMQHYHQNFKQGSYNHILKYIGIAIIAICGGTILLWWYYGSYSYVCLNMKYYWLNLKLPFYRMIGKFNGTTMYNVGECYEQIYNIIRDNIEREKGGYSRDKWEEGNGLEYFTPMVDWFNMACDNGNVNAMLHLADVYKEKDRRYSMINYLQMAVAKNNSIAMNKLGDYYYDRYKTDYSVPADTVENLIKYYEMAIEHNNINAMTSLGDYYYYVKDFANYTKYYTMAVEHDNVEAMSSLGNYYYHEKYDYELGLKYYEMASDKKHAKSMRELGHHYKNNKDYEKMLHYYSLAIKYDDIDSMIALGDYYKEQKNRPYMLSYYDMAQKAGSSVANDRLNEYYGVHR